MRLRGKLGAAAALLLVPVLAAAATCTTQAAMTAEDRDALSAAALRLVDAAAQQNFGLLESSLLPAEASAWDGIRGAAQQAVPLLAGGRLQVRNLYLLDASMQTAPADTEFFCSDKTGSINVTISLPALPPGKFAVALVDASGAPLAGEAGVILGWAPAAEQWKLAGFFAHQGVFDGHDGVWYWRRGRVLAHTDPWSAWYSYEAARYLLLPVDFLTSPNFEKLAQEQEQIMPSPASEFPLSLPAVKAEGRTWKIDSVVLDPSLRQPDLAVVYESSGVTDPAALRTEATSVMSALLKAQPGLRANFHGLWAYAVSDGKRNPVMELPMSQIP